jgi:hypothetical protein
LEEQIYINCENVGLKVSSNSFQSINFHGTVNKKEEKQLKAKLCLHLSYSSVAKTFHGSGTVIFLIDPFQAKKTSPFSG